MLDSLEIAKRLSVIKDDGPIYNEFVHDATVHEPWNAYSSLFFFIPILFWIWRLKGHYHQHKIIVAVLPLLFLNGLGSTLFHAFRNQSIFLFLDSVPASLMSITLSIYFWTKIVRRWYYGLAIVTAFYTTAIFITLGLASIKSVSSFAPNIAYSFVGITLFLPIILLLFRMKFRFAVFPILTALFLLLALFFRILDYPTTNPFPDLLPQGTHFLWHIFSSFAVFSLGFFIFHTNNWIREKSEY